MYKKILHTLAAYVAYGILLLLITSMCMFGKIYAVSSSAIIAGNNEARAVAGLSTLAYSSQLAAAANAKALHMCTYSYWAHTAPDGTTGWTFMKQAGYAYTTAGENLAKGFDSDQAIVNSWMASAGHRANILQPAFKEIGVGSYQCGPAVTDTIVVALYGARAVATAPPAATKPASAPKPSVQPKPAIVAPQTIQVTASVTQNKPQQTVVEPIPIEKPQLKKPTFLQILLKNLKELFVSEFNAFA